MLLCTAFLVRVQRSCKDTIKQSVMDRSWSKWKGSQWFHQAMDLGIAMTAEGFLLTGEAEATCRELSPSLPNSVSDFELFSVAHILGGLFIQPILLPGSPSTEITSILLPNEMIPVIKVFIQVSGISNTVGYSTSIFLCMHLLF